ncbi:MAG: cytochrome c oxidase subunit II [bacterium]
MEQKTESLVQKGSFWYPEAASDVAATTDILFYVILWSSVFLFVAIVATTLYFAFKYRRGQHNLKATGQLIHNLPLELSWTIIPLVLLMFVFYWGFKDYLNLVIPPANATEIRVVGKKWFWAFEYPKEGVKSVGEIVVPVNKPVKFIMTSDDVLHSFYLPNFRTKKDAVPNHYSRIYIEPNRTGVFQIFCTEYCGDGHSKMEAILRVVSQEEYEEFLVSSSSDNDMPLSELGAKLYTKNACNTCHSIDGSRVVGPTWKGLYGKVRKMTDGRDVEADDNYLHRSIVEPHAEIVEGYPAVMPSYSGLLNDRQIAAIIEYIKTLKD